MKKIVCLILALTMGLALFGCAVMEETEKESAFEVLEKAENVSVHLYRDGETSLDLEVTKELLELVEGKWNESAKGSLGDKVLTVTVDTQYEITFFEGGKAMIYYGYAGVLERDRCYYEVELNDGVDSLYDYCSENGTIPETEE